MIKLNDFDYKIITYVLRKEKNEPNFFVRISQDFKYKKFENIN